MFKALMKKQMLGIFAGLSRGKNGQARSRRSLLLYAVLMIYVVGVFGWLFYNLMSMLCAPLISAGLEWLYFSLAGLIAAALGVFGSVFATQSQLYEAKDNELLLSLPIPPAQILLCRMLGLYAETLFFEWLVLIPAELAYLQCAPFSPTAFLLFVLTALIAPLLALAVSCVLGWLIALITSRIRSKSLFTVALSLAFLALYYYLYFKASSYLTLLLDSSDKVGRGMRVYLYPFYQLGRAASGSAAGFVIFAAITAAVFAAVYLVLSRSLISILTRRRGAARVRYSGGGIRTASVSHALFMRELRHLLKSAVYMLNGCLGSLLLTVGTVAAVLQAGKLSELFKAVSLQPFSAPIIAAAVCFLAGSNLLTAPSVSLEGDRIWLIQSLPVSGWQVLCAKLRVHLILTLVPALAFSTAVTAILRPRLSCALLIPVAAAAFVLLTAALGLALNLKFPNLQWKSEAAAVKQSAAPMLSMLASWGIVFAFAGLYFAVGRRLPEAVFLAAVAVLTAGAAALLLLWLKKRGGAIFERL